MSLRAYSLFVDSGFFPAKGGGGGGDSTSTTYTNLIPTYIPGFQQWTEEYLQEAASLSTSNFLPYPGPTYASQDANETDGIAAVATRGRFGSQVELDGKAHLRDLYDGLMQNVNPKLDDFLAKKLEELVENFEWETLPGIRNSHIFAFGGSEHNVAEAKAAAAMMRKINEIAKMYFDDYTQERDLQEQGMVFATPYGLQCIRDMEMLRRAGMYAREYEQGSLMDAWSLHNENQILPLRGLDIYGNAVRTILSTYRQQTVSYYKPPLWTQIAGVALAGLSLYSMFSGTSINPFSKGMLPQAGGASLANTQASLDMSNIQQPGGTFFGGFA